MRIRVLICGILGGLLATYALSYPLYAPTVDLFPFGGSSLMTVIGYALTLAVAVGTGYTAARWSWAAKGRERVKAAELAGCFAAMIAFPLIGAPAAAVASQAPIFDHGTGAAVTDRQAINIVCECVVRSGWYPYLTFWAMFLGGTALAGFGGRIAAWQGGEPWGTTPTVQPDEGCDASIAVMVMNAWILVICLVAISSLEEKCQSSVDRYQLKLSFSTRGVTGWPLLMNLFFLSVSTWFCGRWCARRWNHPVPGAQRVARIGASIMVALPLFILLVVWYLRSDVFGHEFFLAGAAVWCGVMLFWLIAIALSHSAAAPEGVKAATPFRDRLLVNAGLIGALVPGISMATGITQAVALSLGIVPYIPTLLRPYPPLAAASAVAAGVSPLGADPYAAVAILAGGKLLDSPPAPTELPNVHSLIQDIFAFHLWGSFYIVGTWVVYATIHAAIVSAWRRYRLGSLLVAAAKRLQTTPAQL